MELSIEILDEIEVLKETSFRELEYIRDHNWTTISDRVTRISQYEFQDKLTARNIDDAVRFYNMAKSYSSNSEVKRVFEMFKEFLTIYSERFTSYKNIQNWNEYSEDKAEGKKPEDVQAEMVFQSSIIKNLSKLKSNWRRIDSDGAAGSLNLGIFNDIPIPLMFEEEAMKKHDEIAPFLELRREKEKARNLNKQSEDGKSV